MHRSIRAARRRKLAVASILVYSLVSAAPATAEIYKCVSKAGLTMYQNFPCQYDKNPEAAARVMPAVNAAQPKPVQPVAVAANSAAATANANVADPTEPTVGMAAEEVRKLLGEPLEIVQDTPTEGVETWRYLSHNVQIDHSSQQVLVVASW
jgi:hypothetical protein